MNPAPTASAPEPGSQPKPARPFPLGRTASPWLVLASLGTLVGIGLLWAIRPSSAFCLDTFPNQCGGGRIDSPAIVTGGLLIAVLAALFIVAFTVLTHRTLVLWLLCGGLVLIFAIGLLASFAAAASGGPVPLPYYPAAG